MAKTCEVRTELRSAIRYNTVQVPGLRHERARRVADDFASWRLQRHFSYDEDYIHCPTDFDCDSAKNIWILCDFNIGDRLVEVDKVQLQIWKVQYDALGSATFSERSINMKHFTNQYPWGGRDNEWEYRQSKAAVPLDNSNAMLSSTTAGD